MDEPQPPIYFANHVIQQFVGHLFGDTLLVEAKDYMALRLVFRKLGGSWEQLQLGDIQQMDLLKKVVTAWGQMPDRKKQDAEEI
jgi:hypothetical protein